MMEASDNAALDARVVLHDTQQGLRAVERAHEFLGRFVAYPSKEAHDAHALWIAHTHLMDHWDCTPRLAFLSAEPASGKTRALEVTGLLVPNPVEAVNVSPAYLFRKIGAEEGRPTVCYDEIDTVFGPKAKDNEEIRGVLNAGHRRGAVAGRCVMVGKTVQTEELPAYCAVALAGLGWLPDTILTRSVIIRMRRRAPGETVEQFRHRNQSQQAAPIFSALESWARTVPMIEEWPDMPPEIVDRNADVWEPLIAIADIIGGDWPERARAAAVALVSAGQDAGPSLGILLLADIKAAFDSKYGCEALPSKELVQVLNDMEESPWADIKGKPLDERALARRLRAYSIKPETVYMRDRASNPKGYKREQFHDAWERYLPSTPAKSATIATPATVVDFASKNGAGGLRTDCGVADTRRADVAASVARRIAARESIRNTRRPKKPATIAPIADVADLVGMSREELWNADCPKAGETRTCAQCGAEDQPAVMDPHADGDGVAWLHPVCVRFWKASR